MKFTIKRQSFTHQLANILRAVSHTAPIEILKGIKLSSHIDGLTLIGSDAEISIESFLPVADSSLNLMIEQEGSIVLPARLFSEVIRKLPTDTVSIEVNQANVATITSGPAVFEISGIDGNQYPRLPEVDFNDSISLPTLAFKSLINQTIFAASNQENRPVLTGVHLTAHENYLTGVATDSHRLSKREIPMEFSNNEPMFTPITIPKKTLNELVRIVGDNDELKMTVMEQQVIFQFVNNTIYSRLIEGNYPDTDRLIPNSHETELIVDAHEFLSAIDRASLIAHEGKNNTVQLEIKDQNVEVSVPGNEASFVAEEINYQAVSGSAIKISFNPDYMKEALSSFGQADIRIRFQSAIRPLLLVPESESEIKHNDLVQLLTPVRTHYN